ncbi:ribonucleases P/MRP protein subunit POP7 [Naviculisporaceae sp. PSN 640]
MDPQQPQPLPNRPQAKLPPLPKGSRIHKRPLPNAPFNLRQARRDHKQIVRQNAAASQQVVPDLDGYIMPPRAPHTVIIKVSSSSPFMSVVKRVRKALENGPQKTKGLPLTARIAALEVEKDKKAKESNNGNISDALDDVVLIGTGRAIPKCVDIGCFFTREKDLRVIPRTRSIAAIEDIEMDDDDDDEADIEDGVRTKSISVLEVGIRWA